MKAPEAERPVESGSRDKLRQGLQSLRLPDAAQTPRRAGGRIVLPYLVGALGLVAGGLGVWMTRTETVPRTDTGARPEMVATVQHTNSTLVDVDAVGYLVAQEVSHVAPLVAGRVVEVSVVQGDLVEEGAILYRLDATEEEARLAALEADAQASQAQAKVAAARLALSRAEEQNAIRWFQREKVRVEQGLSPSGEADDLGAEVELKRETSEVAERLLSAAEASTRAARAQINVARTRIDHFTVRAPIKGTIINRPPGRGEFVGPQPPGLSVDMGGILIAALSSLVAEVEVREKDWQLVQPGVGAEIVLDAYPGRRLKGQVLGLAPTVDRATASLVVKVKILESVDGMRPNMGARVRFLGDQGKDEPRPIARVPVRALAERGNVDGIFILEGGRVHFRRVTMGKQANGQVEIMSPPLSEGTEILVDPPATVRDGDAWVASED